MRNNNKKVIFEILSPPIMEKKTKQAAIKKNSETSIGRKGINDSGMNNLRSR